MRPEETRGGTWYLVVRAASAPLVFLLSCLIARARPSLAMESWGAVLPAVWDRQPGRPARMGTRAAA